jgi:hypothetical protein
MNTAFKVLAFIAGLSSLISLAISFLLLGSIFYFLPIYKAELREQVAVDRSQILASRPEDISNNIKSLWSVHTINQGLSTFFISRGSIAFTSFGITLFLWVLCLHLQILSLYTKKKTEQGAAANP